MTKVYSQALDQTIEVDRIIGRIDGKKQGPCMIFFGGIHGNEPASVFALKNVIQDIRKRQVEFSGSMIAIAGNLWALERGVRFDQEDLNRLWTEDKMAMLISGKLEPKNEDEKQQIEIFNLLKGFLKTESGPFYFFDLHTTSGDTIPFITVNDSLLNRKFTQKFPVPLILGIEEYLDGPILSYVNELGYVSFGFEGGQHDSLASINNHKVFIYLSLVFTGAIAKRSIPFDDYMNLWISIVPNHRAFYEIYDRFGLKDKDDFKMKPGFSNFQPITKNEKLATLNQSDILSEGNSTLFMPLYQNQGSDGFFLIRKIPRFFLWLSRKLRNNKIDQVFVLLPGIKWHSASKDTMVVNLHIARFIPKEFFHLFGYRSKHADQNQLLLKNREYRSRKKEYCNEKWYLEKEM